MVQLEDIKHIESIKGSEYAENLYPRIKMNILITGCFGFIGFNSYKHAWKITKMI